MRCRFLKRWRNAEKFSEVNQQRRTLSHALSRDCQDACVHAPAADAAARGESDALPLRTRAQMAIRMRSRVAARAPRNAVAGPWTVEYGPCPAGNRKMARTPIRVRTTSSDTVRLDVIRPLSQLYRSQRGNCYDLGFICFRALRYSFSTASTVPSSISASR